MFSPEDHSKLTQKTNLPKKFLLWYKGTNTDCFDILICSLCAQLLSHKWIVEEKLLQVTLAAYFSPYKPYHKAGRIHRNVCCHHTLGSWAESWWPCPILMKKASLHFLQRSEIWAEMPCKFSGKDILVTSDSGGFNQPGYWREARCGSWEITFKVFIHYHHVWHASMYDLKGIMW